MKVGRAFQLRLSPDGRHAVSIGRNVVFWDLQTCRRIGSVHPFKHPSSVDFSPDGSYFAVKNSAGEIRVIDVPELRIREPINLKPYTEGCRVLFSHCGRYIIDGDWSGGLHLHELSTGQVIFSEADPNTLITDLCSAPQKKLVAYVLQPKAADRVSPLNPSKIVVRSWPFAPNRTVLEHENFGWVKAISFDPKGERLVLLQQVKRTFHIILLQIDPTHIIASKVVPWGGANFSVAWSPDGKYVACAESVGVTLYSVPNLSKLGSIPLPYACFVEFSRDTQYLALGSYEQGRIEPISAVIGI